MTESPKSPPGRNFLPVIDHVLKVYKLWLPYQNDLPKHVRYTLGGKVETVFIDILECLFIASYQNKSEKLPTLRLAVRKTDLLKFFLRVLWEIKALDNKKYIHISEEMEEVGRMIGGWKRGLESKLPRLDIEGELR